MVGKLYNIKFRFSQKDSDNYKNGKYNENLPFMNEPTHEEIIELMKLLRPSYENISDIMFIDLGEFDYNS